MLQTTHAEKQKGISSRLKMYHNSNEQYMKKLEVYSKIEEAEQDLENNDYYNADMAVAELRKKHNI